MNALKKLNTGLTKAAVAGSALIATSAWAASPAEDAAKKIAELETGVAAVGAAILGVTLVIVGYQVIKRMANRA